MVLVSAQSRACGKLEKSRCIRIPAPVFVHGSQLQTISVDGKLETGLSKTLLRLDEKVMPEAAGSGLTSFLAGASLFYWNDFDYSSNGTTESLNFAGHGAHS